ncbi:MAG: hypothetical protein ABI650_03220 [Dokdonella sp.]
MKANTLALALMVSLCPTAGLHAANESEQQPASTSQWSAWGGTVGVRLNEHLLGNLGISVTERAGALSADSPRLTDGLNVRQALGIELFALRDSGSIEFSASRGSFAGFINGSLQARGGYVFELANGETIDLTDFRLRPNARDPLLLDIVSSDGQAWFYVNKLMYDLVRDNQVLAIFTSDVRASAALAQRVNHPEMADQPVATFEVLSEIHRQGAGGVRDARGGFPSPSHWHGDPVSGQPSGTAYQADLFMQSFSISRLNSSGVSGPGGNGRVVFTPSSTLRNNVNNGSAAVTVAGQGALGTSTALHTAWIPWNTKFSGISPPYNNDQHPYLIWNMYRVNADGGIEQIGRSGVKHAWLTTNSGCAAGENFSNYVLGRSCSDTYGTFNNDENGDLSFRAEIVPATNQWGRCGSLFDPGCVGSNTNPFPADDGFVRRLVVNEAQISNTVNPGATFLFDSWYLARQDINIYNSMATITGTPTYSGGNWNFAGQSNYRLGSVTDRWVEGLPAATQATNTELAVGEGHSKVAVRVTDLGNGTWRYHYAVHNLDFARAQTSGAEPNLRVLSNKGFDRFSVPLPAGVNVISNRFSDGDLEAANNWSFSAASNALTWTAASANSLDWGTLFLFSVVLDSAPQAGASALRVATAGTPATFTVNALVPTAGNDTIFEHGFE